MTEKQKKRLRQHIQRLNALMLELDQKEIGFEVGEDEDFNTVYLVWTGRKFIVRCGKKQKTPESDDVVLKALDNVQYELGERYGK